jgi:5-methylcytosine-specific restriction endonuclease McrA
MRNRSKYKWAARTGKTSAYYEHKRHYSGNREDVLKRDGYKCVICGISRKDHISKTGRDLSVDHIDGIGTYDLVGGKRNELDRLQTLCSACHIKEGMMRKQIIPSANQHGKYK